MRRCALREFIKQKSVVFLFVKNQATFCSFFDDRRVLLGVGFENKLATDGELFFGLNKELFDKGKAVVRGK